MKEKMNVVIPRVGCNEDGIFYAKNVAYDIDLMNGSMVTFGVPYGKQYTIALTDPDFIICFGITFKELHDMGYIYVGETELKTSWVATAIKKAFEKCIDSGFSSVECGDYYVEAECIDAHDDETSYIEMRILDKNKNTIFAWCEGEISNYR